MRLHYYEVSTIYIYLQMSDYYYGNVFIPHVFSQSAAHTAGRNSSPTCSLPL